MKIETRTTTTVVMKSDLHTLTIHEMGGAVTAELRSHHAATPRTPAGGSFLGHMNEPREVISFTSRAAIEDLKGLLESYLAPRAPESSP